MTSDADLIPMWLEANAWDWKAEGYGANPIYEHDGLWYFWDETWAYFYGPFHSLDVARRELERYAASLEGMLARAER